VSNAWFSLHILFLHLDTTSPANMACGFLYLPCMYSFSTKFKHLCCVRTHGTVPTFIIVQIAAAVCNILISYGILKTLSVRSHRHKYEFFFFIQCPYFIHLKPCGTVLPLIIVRHSKLRLGSFIKSSSRYKSFF
jgi:hypothetical protein